MVFGGHNSCVGSKPRKGERLLPADGNREGLGEKAASELGLEGGDVALGKGEWWYTFAEKQVRAESGPKSSLRCVIGKVCDTEPQQVRRGWGRVARGKMEHQLELWCSTGGHGTPSKGI